MILFDCITVGPGEVQFDLSLGTNLSLINKFLSNENEVKSSVGITALPGLANLLVNWPNPDCSFYLPFGQFSSDW